MLNLSLAGALGRDAEYREGNNGKGRCQFSVAVNIGYGENKSTVWVDVTRWGEGAKGLANLLRKGSKVAVTGEMSTREHNGKTYIQCRADNVTVMNAAGGEGRAPVDPNNQALKQEFAPQHDDLDDSIPFD